MTTEGRRALEEEFDRWLAAHDAEVKAEALEEAATHVMGNVQNVARHLRPVMLVDLAAENQEAVALESWLRSRAAGYRKGQGDD